MLTGSGIRNQNKYVQLIRSKLSTRFCSPVVQCVCVRKNEKKRPFRSTWIFGMLVQHSARLSKSGLKVKVIDHSSWSRDETDAMCLSRDYWRHVGSTRPLRRRLSRSNDDNLGDVIASAVTSAGTASRRAAIGRRLHVTMTSARRRRDG